MTGMDALAEAARTELARVYSGLCPEFKQSTGTYQPVRLTNGEITDEVTHFLAYDWSDAQIALKLGVAKAQVAAVRRRRRAS